MNIYAKMALTTIRTKHYDYMVEFLHSILYKDHLTNEESHKLDDYLNVLSISH